MIEVSRLVSPCPKAGYFFDPHWDHWEEGDELFRARIDALVAAVTIPTQYAEIQPPTD